MAEEWGPWIDHDGKGLPDSVRGRFCRMICECAPGDLEDCVGIAGSDSGYSWCWYFWGKPHPKDHRFLVARVVRYRIRRPLALRRLIDLAADPEKGLPPRFPVEELA